MKIFMDLPFCDIFKDLHENRAQPNTRGFLFLINVIAAVGPKIQIRWDAVVAG